MWKNNRRALALIVGLFIVRTALADIEITGARAVLSAEDPRQAEIYFVLRNGTGHALSLMKIVSSAGERVELKQRSFGATGEPRVWPVARLAIPVGTTLKLTPDGRFFQLSGLAPESGAGRAVSLVLTFEDEAPVLIEMRLESPGR